MFNLKKTPSELNPLDDAIDLVYREMKGFSCDDEEYAKMTDQLVKLLKLKKDIEDPSKKISWDTLAIIGANLLGILLILNYERKDIVTSKALSFLTKLR